MSAGQAFKRALLAEQPLQVMGVVNACAALMAEQLGFQALYLSGAGVANASYGIPDTGETDLDAVLIDVSRITGRCCLPLLVDVDTGWEAQAGIATTVRLMEDAGAAGIQIEDQPAAKRCGHLQGKRLVSSGQMVVRLEQAVQARRDPDFVIVARTDAYAVEGLAAAIARAQDYVRAGADIIFAEALTELSEYEAFSQGVSVPVLANMTEFGQTPLLTVAEFAKAGVRLVLYPLSAFRAMNQAALNVMQVIRREGSQQSVLEQMQTRTQLYQLLDYDPQQEKGKE